MISLKAKLLIRPTSVLNADSLVTSRADLFLVVDKYKPHQFPVHLHIWKALPGQLLQLFKAEDADQAVNDFNTLTKNDPVNKVLEHSEADKSHYLFMEGIVFQFIPDSSRPATKVRQVGQDEIFFIFIRGTLCRINIMNTD
jgi:hypothetical protein